MTKRDPKLPPGEKASLLLGNILKKVRPVNLDNQQLVFEKWAEILGPKMAGSAIPVEFSNGILKVKVASSTLLHLLSTHEKKRLIHQLQRYLPSCHIQNILFRLG